METEYNNIETGSKDIALWKIAKKRAGFKYHLFIYCVVNIFYWMVWYINLGNNSSADMGYGHFPWPVWPMFFWGIGVFFNYLAAYQSSNLLAQREYQKLTHKQ